MTSQAKITVFPAHRLSKINRNIYGGFTEHIGRCIYGGLYDPDNPNNDLLDENGFRKDVIEALKELRIPVVRYPGGNFVATYHWLDGVSPRDKRVKRPDLAWSDVESNQFGTDEFEMERLTKDTYYANLRRQNGRQKSYNVKYWALGNECWGPWQVEQMTKEDYAKKAWQWGKALKLLEPSITLISCGLDGRSDWDHYVLRECLKIEKHALSGSNTTSLIDMHSIHIYTTSVDPTKNAFAPLSAERSIEICAGLIDLARIENGVPASIPRQQICFDEWNVWDSVRAPGEKGAEELYNLSDALAVAIWLNVFVRQSKYVGMANVAQSVNVISPLMTTKDGVVKQTPWWPLLLFSKYMHGHLIATNVQCSAYEGATEPEWLRSVHETPWLDVSATIDEDGFVNLVVVNVSPDTDFETGIGGIELAGWPVKTYVVTGDSWDNVSTPEKETIKIDESEWDGQGSYTFSKMSMSLLRWKNTRPA